MTGVQTCALPILTGVAPGPGVPVPPRARAGHPRELAGRSPAPVATAGEPCLGAADEAPTPRVAGAAPPPRHRPGRAGGMPSKQPTIGERQALPAGMRNSVTSVTHFSLGASAPRPCLPPGARASAPSPSRRRPAGPPTGPLAALEVTKGPVVLVRLLPCPRWCSTARRPVPAACPELVANLPAGTSPVPSCPSRHARDADLVGHPSPAMAPAQP